ncbi:hypothetical protein HDU92_007362, partial [Lobulomyces angularis]
VTQNDSAQLWRQDWGEAMQQLDELDGFEQGNLERQNEQQKTVAKPRYCATFRGPELRPWLHLKKKGGKKAQAGLEVAQSSF